ncbi:MAG: FmdB family zinc ribbon protein [Actinomycetota bacterium]
MPTYEYRCTSCGAAFESRRTIADADAAIPCPQGHESTVRQLSVFSVTTTVATERPTRPAGAGCGPGCACAANG